jgi:hypothetical protein
MKKDGAVPYAQALTSQEVPPPYFFPGVTTHGFVIDVSVSKVQAYCDTMFNLGDQETRGFVYRTAPAWPYAMVLFIQYPTMIASPRKWEETGETSYSDRGAVSQTEVFICIPVVRYGTTVGGAVIDTTVDWALPFIVVGNPMSASCGREMLGMGKLLAHVDIGQAQYPGSFSGSVKLPAYRTATSDQERREFLRVTTAPPMPTHWGSRRYESPWSLLETRAGGDVVSGIMGLLGYANRMAMGTLPLTMRTVSLKQFRDAKDPETAIYQALVTCRSRYTNIENVRFFNEKDVKLTFHNDFSFNPILQIFMDDELLRGDPPTVAVQPRAAYSLSATVDFDEMRTIYRAPIDPGPTVAPGQPFRDTTATWARPWMGFFKGAPPTP